MRDAKFALFMPCSILFLTFIIKLIYVFIFDKYLKSKEDISNKGEPLYNIDYENE